MAGETFSQIFTPVPEDFGLISLRRILGCTMDTIWQAGTAGAASGGCTGSQMGMIATAAGFFNYATAIVAGLLVTYTIFVAIADTARDGEAAGRSVHMGYTVARIALGIVMIMPVSAGFSVAQIAVIQIVVWGSGAADNLWSKISEKITLGGYTEIAAFPEDDARLRGMIAQAIQTRALGYVCAYRLNTIADAFGAGSPMDGAIREKKYEAASMLGRPALSSPSKSYFFEDKEGFYNRGTSLCGVVTLTMPQALDTPASASPTASVDKDTGTRLRTLAVSAVTAGIAGAWQAIDVAAAEVYQAVRSGSRDEAAIKASISGGVTRAQAALRTGMQQMLTGQGSQAAQIARQYLEETRKSGWIFAVSWQRAGISVSQYFQTLLDAVSITSTSPGSLQAVLQPMARPGWLSDARLTGSVWQTIAQDYERDMGFLLSLSGFVQDFGKAGASGVAGQLGTPAGGLSIAGAMQWVLSKLTVDSGSTGYFRDPLLGLVEIGGGLSGVGFAALGTSAAMSLGQSVVSMIPVVGDAYSGTTAALWAVGAVFVAAGFWIGGVLPLAPLVYFFGAVLSWLVICIEALVAVPLWLLSFFFPAREPSLIGASRQGWLLLFGLLVRPMLIIFGLVLSVLLMGAAFTILNILFSSVLSLSMPLDGSGIGTVIVSAAVIVVYLAASTVVVMNSCAMISELCDASLRWIEVGVQSLWSARFAGEAMQPINPGAGLSSAGRQLAGGMGQMPASLRPERDASSTDGAKR